MGNVLLNHGNPAEALKFFSHSLTVDERLALADPSNVGRQHDLAIANERLGNVYKDLKYMRMARLYLEKAMFILKELDDASRLEPRGRLSMAQLKQQLAALQATPSMTAAGTR